MNPSAEHLECSRRRHLSGKRWILSHRTVLSSSCSIQRYRMHDTFDERRPDGRSSTHLLSGLTHSKPFRRLDVVIHTAGPNSQASFHIIYPKPCTGICYTTSHDYDHIRSFMRSTNHLEVTPSPLSSIFRGPRSVSMPTHSGRACAPAPHCRCRLGGLHAAREARV